MRYYFLVMLLFCVVGGADAQDIRSLTLKQERTTYSTKNFYISDVVDDRKPTDSIGYAIRTANKKEKVNLKDGAARALKTFIANNVPQDKTKQAMVLHITKLSYEFVNHGPSQDATSVGEAVFTFYVGDKKILALSGKSSKTSPEVTFDFVDEFIKSALENDLKKFDEWWGQNGGKIPIASTVKVNATIGKVVKKPGCIVYSAKYQLAISDFTGEPPTGEGAELASTMSAIGMESTGQTKDGQIVLDVVFTPYFDKLRSWFKEAGKNPRVLAHEQAHFDIMAVKACELVAKINATVFSKDKYEQQIQDIFSQFMSAANTEETKFDAETNHNRIADKEHEWERKVKEQIKGVGCY